MKKYLWVENNNEKLKAKDRRDRLYGRQCDLDSFIEKSYEDKMKGLISQELGQSKNEKWN